MSNFSYTRPGGVWTSLSGLTAAEMADIDHKTALAMSGEGGTYSLLQDMVVGGAPGADWTFDLPVLVTDTLSVQGAFSVFGALSEFVGGMASYDYLNVYGVADFYNDVTYHDVVYYQSLALFLGNCEMFGNVFMGNTSADFLLVSATADFEGPVSFNDPVHVYDTWTFHTTPAFQAGAAFNGGTVTFLSATTLGVPLQFSLDGRIPKRQVIGANANTSYSPRNVDHVYVGPGGITGDVEYQIDDTGAVDGDRIRFTNESVNYQVAVKTGITYLSTIKNVAGTYYWCEVERVAGGWRRVGSGRNT